MPDDQSSSRGARRAANVSPPDPVSLRSSRDFARVLKNGRRERSGAIVLVCDRGQSGPARVGLVVSKGSGNAVARNRIKRRLRHTVPTLQMKPGNDYVIIASKRVVDAPQHELQAWLARALEGLDRG